LDAFNNAYLARDRKVPLELSSTKVDKEEHIQPFFVKPEVMDQVKKPTFDVWNYKENELIYIFLEIFKDLGLLEAFKIDRPTLIKFLATIRKSYNPNPFHNFRHCFCVTQMMYSIINITGARDKLTPLDLLVLTVSCIGHDLDHPGTNNAYQVNAMTDLAIIYNDSSPLENHHAAMLFMILRKPETNILSELSPADFKEARKLILTCILSTDMAKHGEIIAKFKSYMDDFSFQDINHKTILLQMLIKCSDISNEVRPNSVADTWVDNLLEEFFTQSDKEKAEGLPTAPFMDRQKVTKPSAQGILKLYN
jgi:high affinity cGMP-specific 3',5'-cyclic phosphodiesterase 9